MKFLKYKDFDDLFINLNYEILSDPDKYIFYHSGANGYIGPLVIQVEEPNFAFDLGRLSYTPNKFSKLVTTYININTLHEFKEKLKNSSATTITFYFNQSKPKIGSATSNGPCILSIVLTRRSRKDIWTAANVMYRTTEVNRRFAADLLMLNRFVNELPECCDIKEVRIFIPQAYISAHIISAYLKVFGFSYEELDDGIRFHKSIINFYDRYLIDSNKLHNYKAIQRVQKAYFGLKKWKPIDPEQFSIEKVLSK